MTCDCFTCKNKDNKDRLYGYYIGQKEALETIINALKEYGYKASSLGDNNLNGFLACCECDLEAVNEFLAELNME